MRQKSNQIFWESLLNWLFSFFLPSHFYFTLAKQVEIVTAKLSDFGTNQLLYLINIGAIFPEQLNDYGKLFLRKVITLFCFSLTSNENNLELLLTHNFQQKAYGFFAVSHKVRRN